MLGHIGRARRNGFDDIMISRAAADIALKFVPDGRLVERMSLAVHEVDGGHDHARRAIAALQAMMLAEGFLHRMQMAMAAEALNGRHMRAFAGQC